MLLKLLIYLFLLAVFLVVLGPSYLVCVGRAGSLDIYLVRAIFCRLSLRPGRPLLFWLLLLNFLAAKIKGSQFSNFLQRPLLQQKIGIASLIALLIAFCILLLVADSKINILVLVTWQLGLENEFVVLEVEDVEAATARVSYQVL